MTLKGNMKSSELSRNKFFIVIGMNSFSFVTVVIDIVIVIYVVN